MSRDLGQDVPDLEKCYASKLWADFRSLHKLLEIGNANGGVFGWGALAIVSKTLKSA